MSEIEVPVDPARLKLVNPHSLHPGAVVWFRWDGTAEPRQVTVLPRGPLGQFYVDFGGQFAVNQYRELFELAP